MKTEKKRMQEKLSGGEWSKAPILYSNHSKHIFHALGNDMNVLNSVTGERLFQLSKHTQPITCIVQMPSNSLRVITGSLDGTCKSFYGKIFIVYNKSYPLFII